MKLSERLRLAFALAFSASASISHAGFVYDDGLPGNDLSNVGTIPSALVLGAGSNLLNGTTGNGDRDYVTLTLPTGYLLSALYLRPGTTVAGTSSFIEVQVGSQVTVDPGTSSAAGLLSWHLYSPADID